MRAAMQAGDLDRPENRLETLKLTRAKFLRLAKHHPWLVDAISKKSDAV